MKTETEWAIRNLELAGWFNKESDYDGMIGEAVKNLLETHQKEGHSGFSHQITVNLFKKVALDEALTLEYWNEKFEAYKEFFKSNGAPPMTEAEFEAQVMKKPDQPTQEAE